MADLKPPCKKRFLAKSIHDLAEFTAHYGITPPDGHDVALKTLEQRPWSWFAKALHDVSSQIYGESIAHQLRPMDRQWGTAMGIAYEPARIGALVFIWDARPGRDLDRYMDAVGVLVEIDREKNARRLYEEDGGPAFCGPRYHLQNLDGKIITWGNCFPRNIITHRVAQLNRDIHKSVFLDR